MRAIVTIIDEKTGHIFEKDKLLAPFREQRDPRYCCTEYTFAFRFNVLDRYFKDILDNTPVVDQPPIPYHDEILPSVTPQEPILDKIKAEVENINVWGMRYNPGTNKDEKPRIVQKVKEHVIEIIDKYKAETEGEG